MRIRLVALVAPCLLLAACAEPADLEDLGAHEAAVTCPANILRYPIRGPHNTGYDPAWNDFRCDGSLGNTDYGGDHHGIDLFAPRGTPVVSPVDGVVVRAGVASSSSGNRVTVQDGCGWAYYHGHLDSIAAGIAVGVRVRAGDVIGAVGNTGTPTAPHVHFNVSRDASYYDDIDPFPLLRPMESSSCGPDPACAGHPATFCADATRIANCSTGRYDVGDCAAFGTTCDEDTGVARCTPHLDGVFVGSDFPGGVRIEVPLGTEVRGCLDYRNTGAWTWDGLVRLGTSMPRDRASEHVGSDWIGPNRLASVSAETAHGAIGRFCFSLHAASAVGEREERFSLVREGSFWAADVGGVADDVNVLHVVTVERPTDPAPTDPVPTDPVPMDPVPIDPGPTDPATFDDGGISTDGGPGAPGRPMMSGGCAVSADPPSSKAPLALLVVALLGLRRRRLTAG